MLVKALAEVVDYSRTHSGLSGPRVMLVGHSLGSGVVGDYALSQPVGALAATVLISPVLRTLPTRSAPANPQILVGAHDTPGLEALAVKLTGAACKVRLPATTTSYTCGDPARGNGRELLVLPGATHVTILGDRQAFEEVTRWAGATAGIPAGPIQSDTRLVWFVVGVLCALLALAPVAVIAAMLLPASATPATVGREPPLGLGAWARLGIFALGAALTALLLRLWALGASALALPALRTPQTWLIRMQLADYFAASALTLAVAVCALAWALRRRLPLAALGARPWWPAVALGAMLFAFVYVTLGPLVTFSFDRLLLNTARGLRFIPLAASSVALVAVIEGMFAETRGWRFTLTHLGAYGLVIAGALAAIALDMSLGFFSLIAPFEMIFFLVFTGIAVALRRIRRDYALAAALFAGLTLAWLVAAVFPIT